MREPGRGVPGTAGRRGSRPAVEGREGESTTRRQGFEIEARARVTRQWGAHLSYACTEATFQDDLQLATSRLTPGCAVAPCTQAVKAGNDLPLIPRHRINAGVDHDVTPWLTLWLSGSFVGSQRFRGDEENVERKLPPARRSTSGGISYRF